MTITRVAGVLVAAAGIVALAITAGPSVSGPFNSHVLAQTRQDRSERRTRNLSILAGRDAEVGASVRDDAAGVTVEEVRPDSPAEKAGFKAADLVVDFDGERVRSARQFSRLVQETPPGRTVKTTVMRDHQKRELQLTVPETRHADVFADLADHLPPFNFNFDFDLPEIGSGRRLGVTVQEMPDQLSSYFGAKRGVLVTAVTDGSPAAHAGLKAGDVITSVDGAPVESRDDLVRALRDATTDQVAVGIVRDKKETTVTATFEAPRRRARGVRPV